MYRFSRSSSQSSGSSSGVLTATGGFLMVHEFAPQPSQEFNDYAQNVTSDYELQIPSESFTSALAGNCERSSAGLDGTYANSCEGTECVSNLRRNRYFPFSLEPQQLKYGRCEHFEKTRDVNEGEFSKQRRSEKPKNYVGQLLQGDGSTDISSRQKYLENWKPIHSEDEQFPYDNVPKNTSSTLFNFEAQKKTPQRANSVAFDKWLEMYEQLHDTGRQFQFDESNVAFNHRSWIHTEKKTPECDTSVKAFSRRYDRKRQELIQTGEESFQCFYCYKTFADMGKLKEHALTHLRGHTAEKLFQCKNCEKTFSASSSLRKHERMVHSREKRSSFQYNEFTRKQNFENRMRIHHSGEDPLKCVTSMKSYSCPSALKRREGTDRYDPVNSPSISNGIGLDQREQKLNSDQTLFQHDIRNAEFSLQKKLDEQCDDLVQRFRRHKV